MSYISSFLATSSGATTATDAGVVIPATATMCLGFVGMRGADGGATTLSDFTLDGVGFTSPVATSRIFTGFQAIEFMYMPATNITSGTVTATSTRTTGTDGMEQIIMFFDDAIQTEPPLAMGGAASSPADPFENSVTTTDNSTVADMIITPSNVTWGVQETDQIERENQNVGGGSLDGAGSTREVASSGSIQMGWSHGTSSRMSHLLAAVEVAAVTGEPFSAFNRQVINLIRSRSR